MNDQIHIKPAPGLVVRDPETKQPLAPEGELKPRSTYWLRRLNDGDVTEASATKQTKKTGSAAPTVPAA